MVDSYQMTDPNDEFEREPFGVKFHSPSTGNSISSKTSETLINIRHLESSHECGYHTKYMLHMSDSATMSRPVTRDRFSLDMCCNKKRNPYTNSYITLAEC